MSTPKDYLEMSYEAVDALIRKDPSKLETFINQERFSSEQKQQLCLVAVQTKWMTIYKVPDELLNDDIIIACLNDSLDYANELSRERITPKIMMTVKENVQELEYLPDYLRTPEVCLSAVKKIWKNIEMVPDDSSYKDVFLEAVQRDWRAFFSLPVRQQRDPEILTILKRKWSALDLKSFPEHYEINELWLIALSLDAALFSKIPVQQRSPEICLAVVKEKPALINQVPNQFFLEVCIEWVRKDSMALAYIPNKVKQEVIDTLTPEKILSADFRSAVLFPEEDTYQKVIEQFLDNTEHVVVTKQGAFERDGEIKDSYLVYANTEKRLGKTLHVDANDIHSLLDNIKNNPKINLVLLAHDAFFDGENKIGGLSKKEIIEILTSYPNINRITLLSCNSAKSLVLDAEKEINKRLVQKMSREAPLPSCGLVLMSSIPDEGKCTNALKEMNSDRAFIWVKEGEEHSLLYFNKENGANEQLQLKLSPEQIVTLHKTLFPNMKKLPFPRPNEREQYMRRGIEGAKLMDKKEFEAFHRVFFAGQKYSRKNPEYKTNKQFYSFFNNIHIDELEYPKLKPSLLKDFIDLIRAAKLGRTVYVKGYNFVVHADTLGQRFIAAIKELKYASGYKEKNLTLFFDNSKSSIDNDGMEKEMEKMVSRVINQVEDEPRSEKEELSQAKSITYEVNSKQ